LKLFGFLQYSSISWHPFHPLSPQVVHFCQLQHLTEKKKKKRIRHKVKSAYQPSGPSGWHLSTVSVAYGATTVGVFLPSSG